jgi:hypothetical protein
MNGSRNDRIRKRPKPETTETGNSRLISHIKLSKIESALNSLSWLSYFVTLLNLQYGRRWERCWSKFHSFTGLYIKSKYISQ